MTAWIHVLLEHKSSLSCFFLCFSSNIRFVEYVFKNTLSIKPHPLLKGFTRGWQGVIHAHFMKRNEMCRCSGADSLSACIVWCVFPLCLTPDTAVLLVFIYLFAPKRYHPNLKPRDYLVCHDCISALLILLLPCLLTQNTPFWAPQINHSVFSLYCLRDLKRKRNR